jgi:hypothetical protein
VVTPAKIGLEVVLLAAAVGLFGLKPDPANRRFLLWFTGLAVVLNAAFYYVAVGPFFPPHAQSSGMGASGLGTFVLFDVVKWGVLAYVLGNAALAVSSRTGRGGFALGHNAGRLSSAAVVGCFAGVAATAAAYGLSIVEHRTGILEALPWPFMKDNPAFARLAFWGGLHNLAGEEILTRLGAQSLLMHVLRGKRLMPFAAILLSSLYFEFWHNGLRDMYLLNFAASCVFGVAYHLRRYESAAIAHCSADWLGLLVLPRLAW